MLPLEVCPKLAAGELSKARWLLSLPRVCNPKGLLTWGEHQWFRRLPNAQKWSGRPQMGQKWEAGPCLELGTSDLDLELGPAPSNLGPGIWNLGPSPGTLEPGTWNLEPCMRDLEPGPWILGQHASQTHHFPRPRTGRHLHCKPDKTSS